MELVAGAIIIVYIIRALHHNGGMIVASLLLLVGCINCARAPQVADARVPIFGRVCGALLLQQQQRRQEARALFK